MLKISNILYGLTGTTFGLALLATAHAANAGTEKVLYNFSNSQQGANPASGLLNIGGTLYGTTANGGSANHGTVFSVTPSGVQTVLYSFKGGTDGAAPLGDLINIGNTLYGTTSAGGTTGQGTVFSLTTAGVETVLYSFIGGTDGAAPYSGLLNVNGTLFGTTSLGGNIGAGTVYSITLAGAEKVLYTFQAGTDGIGPSSGLINVNGTLYGTTQFGGDIHVNDTHGFGIVYSVTTAGVEKVVYAFKGAVHKDGSVPNGGLVDVDGTLYGTTYFGGKTAVGGTVYSVTTAGVEKVLHNFGTKSNDGANPNAALIAVDGTLYGTTWYTGNKYFTGNGTVFSITPAGSEKLVYTFKGNGDGQQPRTDLTNIGNTLYGTTFLTSKTSGGGVVFSLTTPNAARAGKLRLMP